jgi:uncharacterized protein (TIGR02597 family)
MKKLFLLISLVCFLPVTGFPTNVSVTGEIVGTQTIRAVNAGNKHCHVSIPFIKPSVIQGNIDSVDTGNAAITDNEGGFALLQNDATYFLLVLSGSSKGDWFVINKPESGKKFSDTPNRITIDIDKSTGALENLKGDERFSVHAMYRLNELFPENGNVLPSNKFDVMAGQVQFYSGNTTKYWLSNGELTEKPGWTKSSGNFELDNLYIPPGKSFIVFHPNPIKNIDIQIIGQVPSVPIKKKIVPGYNYVAAEFNTSRTDTAGNVSRKISDMKLAQSGFKAGNDANESDTLMIWDKDLKDYRSGIWLSKGGQWMTKEGMPAGNLEIQAGTGIIILNKGNSYIWKDGE